MKCLTFYLAFFCSTILFAQSSIFNSAFKGNSFIQIGSSVQVINPSTLHFIGNDFDFSIHHASFSPRKTFESDRPSSRQMLNSFSIEMGHYIKRGVLMSVNFDQMGYQLKHQTLLVSGSIPSNIDQLSGLPQSSNNTFVSMDSIGFDFNVAQSNRISINFSLSQNLFRTPKRGFVLNAIYGIGAGAVHSTSTIYFGTALQPSIKSLSGFTTTANAGLRFEFLRHFYLLTNLSGVLLSNRNIRLDLSDGSQFVKSTMLYGQGTLFIGYVFSFKRNKLCDCPKF